MRIAILAAVAVCLAPTVVWGACVVDAKQKWTGSGTMTTRPFHMDGPWEIQWSFTAKPMMFQIMVYTKGESDQMPSIAANQLDGTPGSAYQPRGGDYYLTFNTFGGNWTACVVSVPE